MDSSYRVTKDELCKAVCAMDNISSIPRCAKVNCFNCPVFTTTERDNNYPLSVFKANRTLNES